jgi:hypothetical protein
MGWAEKPNPKLLYAYFRVHQRQDSNDVFAGSLSLPPLLPLLISCLTYSTAHTPIPLT